MTVTRVMTCCVVVALLASAAAGFDETWDTDPPGNNKWAYWDTDFGAPPHHHRPMNHFTGGGVGGTGHVQTPLGEMEPAFIHDAASYWPAYPGEDFEFAPFPYINLDIPGAAISVYIKGLHNPVGPPVDLGGGQVRFFIGYYDGHDAQDPDDDEQAFFCTNGTFDVGDNAWAQSTVVLGDDADWMTIVKEEDPGTDTQPTDLYNGPQQWGFAIHPVPLGNTPGGGALGFDEFHLVPEPATLAILGLGGLLIQRRKE